MWALMRQLCALLWPILLISIAIAQNRPEPIRLCVSTLENSSRETVDPTWQGNQLIKAFERNNKGKDVTKGKVARIETVQLESDSETDPAVRENNGQFILYINLIEAINAGSSDISASRPRSVDVGRGPDDRRADASGDNRATIRCRIMRAGEIQ